MPLPYAIMRFEKRKRGAIRNLAKHHERKKQQYYSNPDIDFARTDKNYHLVEPTQDYAHAIDNRIQQVGCKVRKDSVLFIDTLITASPEFFDSHPERDERIYFEQAVYFLKQEIGADNIISAVVHKDEANPHLHVCFVPITSDGRLCAKEIIGNRNTLIEWQDKFHEHMSRAFPELERGEPASETKRKHMPTRIFKQAVQLDDQMFHIKVLLAEINPLNAQKKKNDIQEMLSEWMGQYKSFQNQLRPYENEIKILRENQRLVQEEADRASARLSQSASKQHQLQQQLWQYDEFLKSIPEDLRRELLTAHRREQDLQMNQ